MHVEIWYLEALAKEIYTAKQRVEALAHQVYPSTALREFVSGELHETIAALWSIVDEQISTLKRDPYAPLSSRCAKAVWLWNANYLQTVIASVSEADIHSHPLEMMLYMRELASQVAPNDRIEVVTVPLEELNFSFREIWAHLRPFLSASFGLPPRPHVKYVELTYPKGEKDNILRSAVFAHELGHYVDHALHLTNRLIKMAYVAILPRLPLIRASGDEHRNAPEPALAELIVNGILRNWMREAVADCFAVRVLGPAYYLCHAEIQGLVAGRQTEHSVTILDQASISHPRPSLRLEYQRSLMAELEKDLPNETRELLDHTLEVFRTRAVVAPILTSISNEHVAVHLVEPIYRVLEAVWRDLLPHVTMVVDQHVPSEVQFSADDYRLAVTLVREKLEWLIPPNEHNGQPVKASVIINAGWHARRFSLETMRSRIASLPEGLEGNHQVVDMLNGLLKYALYAAHVHHRWMGS